MKYVSSRNSKVNITCSQAMIKGLAEDGGLFTPLLENEKIDLSGLKDISYKQLAERVISFFLRDFSKEEIVSCIEKAYDEKFDDKEITPLIDAGKFSILELWHGPTSAFKDLALTLLPHQLTKAYEKNGCKQTLAILTATSGDTGKAALASFADVKNTAITVFYPEVGVSDIQKKQMQTSKGNNVEVIAVKGNFDDCQRLVKKATTDPDILNGINNVTLSSANSINVGRLIPQVVYYYYAYLKLLKEGKINEGEEINFSVPTGNFGNILAGYLAKNSGLPIKKLICASNSNNILTDFINTGKYDLHRDFINTMSPSMDILISSNLERLLYLLSEDDQYIRDLMKKLETDGFYEVDKQIKEKINSDFAAYWSSEKDCEKMISYLFNEKHILIDPHTAVAADAYRKYKNETKDQTKTVVLSTASPYKFAGDVLKCLEIDERDPYKAMEKLGEISGMKIPQNLAELKDLPVRFTRAIEIEEGFETIRNRLKEISDAAY
ncbi:MAG: threonine synthase [Erysipelotrichaceae bacterium]|nr:threonine synthase [Erysipelotrichaceae bacterium]